MASHQFDDKKANLKTLISAIGAKEVDCRVKLIIHTVTNLPVLDGSFRVKWKFRDIDSKLAKQHKKDLEKKLTGDSGYGLTAALGVAASLAGSSVANSVPTQAQKNADLSTEEKGSTSYHTLRARDHTVTLEHTVEVVAHMRIVKGELIGEPLKLVVERRMEESEVIGTNKKFEPRVGHKYIDLAEFVNEGKVRRKFLLERSKTNAMVTVSLNIVTTKTGIEFKKPTLRQDHLLIGRKEPIPLLGSEKGISRVNTSNASGTLKPSLTRASSTTSTTSSSAVSRGISLSTRGFPPSKTETEAVIEALFNPTIFTSSPAVTPSVPTPSGSPIPSTFEEAASRSKSRKDSKKKDSIGGKSEVDVIVEEQDVQAKWRRKRDSTNSTTSNPNRHGSLGTGKTILETALELNNQMDRERTLRPRLTPSSGENWDFILFPDGSQGLKRKSTDRGHRTDTGDSFATDFSTTSTKSYTSTSTPSSPGPNIISPVRASSPVSGLPSISIIAGTPTITTPENLPSRGKWYKRFRRTSFEGSAGNINGTPTSIERRATTPVTFDSGINDGKQSAEFAKLPLPSKGTLGPVKAEDQTGPQLDGGQLTPTPTKGA